MRSFNEQSWTIIIGAGVVLFIVFSFLLVEPVRKRDRQAAAHPARVSQRSVPLVTGDEPIVEIFTRAGCPVCHTIPGVEGALGQVGPPLTLATTGPQRLADPGYGGRAKTVREYVIESTLAPGTYVVPGYPERTMPTWYGRKLTAQALDKIAAYLSQIEAE